MLPMFTRLKLIWQIRLNLATGVDIDVGGGRRWAGVLDAIDAIARMRDRHFLPVLKQAFRYKKDSDIRRDAAKALVSIVDKSCFEMLIGALSDKDWGIRIPVAQALAQLGDKRAGPKVLEALKNERDDTAKAALIDALRILGDVSCIPVLIAMLGLDHDDIRMKAASLLYHLGEPEWATIIKGEYGDFERLAALRDKRTVVPLIDMLRSPQLSTRRRAAEALGEIGDVRAVQPLCEALPEGIRGHISPGIFDEIAAMRTAIVLSLGKLKDPRALPSLISALEMKFPDLGSDLRSVRVAAAAARELGEIGDPAAIEPLVAALEQNDVQFLPIVRAATRSLGRFQGPPVVSALRSLLDHSDEAVRQAAMDASCY